MLLQIVNFMSVLASGLMIWKGLGLLTNTQSPIVVVLSCVLFFTVRLWRLTHPVRTYICAYITHISYMHLTHLPGKWCAYSGSMEPAFYRGDLLFLTHPPSERYETGDVIVYKVPGADIPIVHRVLETHGLVVKDKG